MTINMKSVKGWGNERVERTNVTGEGKRMNCQHCKMALEHDDQIIVFENKIFHECECFTDYMIENLADETELTYLEYLEKLVIERGI